jgi:rod shape-determining protein MreD
MSRIAASPTDLRILSARRNFVPIASTMFACLLSVLPIVMSSPIIPDFAFLVLIAWRLLRPELWSAPVVLPLGLFNDLVAGHPVGQSMALWTLLFLIYDVMDVRLQWRDYWMDWFVAGLSIISYTYGVWYIGHRMGNTINFQVMLPQLGLSILCYPIIARMVLTLDKWRLAR